MRVFASRSYAVTVLSSRDLSDTEQQKRRINVGMCNFYMGRL